MFTINLSNRAAYAKVLAEQASGQKPLYLGPARYGKPSSADISVDQFLAYFDSISMYTKQRRDIDGNASLTVISDNGLAEVTTEQLLEGLIVGKLGPEAQAKAVAWKTQRDATEAGRAAVAAERRALLTGAALRASV